MFMSLTDLRQKSDAERALELHGQELEADHPLNVYISNPERKKARTDHDADEKELYVAGLSKFTTEADLEKIFRTVRHFLCGHFVILIICSMVASRGCGWQGTEIIKSKALLLSSLNKR